MAKRDKEEAKKGMEDIFASSGVDMVSAIVARDRARTGREKKTEPANYNNKTSKNVIIQSDIMTSHKPIKQTSKLARTSTQKSKPSPEPLSSEKGQDSTLLATRIEEAKKMAESPTMTVTLRIPQLLNEWLDEYVHGAWREKIKKQDLVIEALCLAIARRGRPGEEVIATDLLPKDK